MSPFYVLHTDNITALRKYKTLKSYPSNYHFKKSLGYYVINESLKYYDSESDDLDHVIDKISSYLIGIFYEISTEKQPLKAARLASAMFLCDLHMDNTMNFYDPLNIVDKCIIKIALVINRKLSKVISFLEKKKGGFRLDEVYSKEELHELKYSIKYYGVARNTHVKSEAMSSDEECDIDKPSYSTVAAGMQEDSKDFLQIPTRNGHAVSNEALFYDDTGAVMNWKMFGLRSELFEPDPNCEVDLFQISADNPPPFLQSAFLLRTIVKTEPDSDSDEENDSDPGDYNTTPDQHAINESLVTHRTTSNQGNTQKITATCVASCVNQSLTCNVPTIPLPCDPDESEQQRYETRSVGDAASECIVSEEVTANKSLEADESTVIAEKFDSEENVSLVKLVENDQNNTEKKKKALRTNRSYSTDCLSSNEKTSQINGRIKSNRRKSLDDFNLKDQVQPNINANDIISTTISQSDLSIIPNIPEIFNENESLLTVDTEELLESSEELTTVADNDENKFEQNNATVTETVETQETEPLTSNENTKELIIETDVQCEIEIEETPQKDASVNSEKINQSETEILNENADTGIEENCSTIKINQETPEQSKVNIISVKVIQPPKQPEILTTTEVEKNPGEISTESLYDIIGAEFAISDFLSFKDLCNQQEDYVTEFSKSSNFRQSSDTEMEEEIPESIDLSSESEFEENVNDESCEELILSFGNITLTEETKVESFDTKIKSVVANFCSSIKNTEHSIKKIPTTPENLMPDIQTQLTEEENSFLSFDSAEIVCTTHEEVTSTVNTEETVALPSAEQKIDQQTQEKAPDLVIGEAEAKHNLLLFANCALADETAKRRFLRKAEEEEVEKQNLYCDYKSLRVASGEDSNSDSDTQMVIVMEKESEERIEKEPPDEHPMDLSNRKPISMAARKHYANNESQRNEKKTKTPRKKTKVENNFGNLKIPAGLEVIPVSPNKINVQDHSDESKKDVGGQRKMTLRNRSQGSVDLFREEVNKKREVKINCRRRSSCSSGSSDFLDEKANSILEPKSPKKSAKRNQKKNEPLAKKTDQKPAVSNRRKKAVNSSTPKKLDTSKVEEENELDLVLFNTQRQNMEILKQLIENPKSETIETSGKQRSQKEMQSLPYKKRDTSLHTTFDKKENSALTSEDLRFKHISESTVSIATTKVAESDKNRKVNDPKNVNNNKKGKRKAKQKMNEETQTDINVRESFDKVKKIDTPLMGVVRESVCHDTTSITKKRPGKSRKAKYPIQMKQEVMSPDAIKSQNDTVKDVPNLTASGLVTEEESSYQKTSNQKIAKNIETNENNKDDTVTKVQSSIPSGIVTEEKLSPKTSKLRKLKQNESSEKVKENTIKEVQTLTNSAIVGEDRVLENTSNQTSEKKAENVIEEVASVTTSGIVDEEKSSHKSSKQTKSNKIKTCKGNKDEVPNLTTSGIVSESESYQKAYNPKVPKKAEILTTSVIVNEEKSHQKTSNQRIPKQIETSEKGKADTVKEVPSSIVTEDKLSPKPSHQRKLKNIESSEKNKEDTVKEVQNLSTNAVVSKEKASQKRPNQRKTNKSETSATDIVKEVPNLITSGNVSEKQSPQNTLNESESNKFETSEKVPAVKEVKNQTFNEIVSDEKSSQKSSNRRKTDKFGTSESDIVKEVPNLNTNKIVSEEKSFQKTPNESKSNKFETSEKGKDNADKEVQNQTLSGIVSDEKSSQKSSNRRKTNKYGTNEKAIVKEVPNLFTSGNVSESKSSQKTLNESESNKIETSEKDTDNVNKEVKNQTLSETVSGEKSSNRRKTNKFGTSESDIVKEVPNLNTSKIVSEEKSFQMTPNESKSNKFETSEKGKDNADKEVQNQTLSGIVSDEKSSQKSSNRRKTNKYGTNEKDIVKEVPNLFTSGNVSEAKSSQQTLIESEWNKIETSEKDTDNANKEVKNQTLSGIVSDEKSSQKLSNRRKSYKTNEEDTTKEIPNLTSVREEKSQETSNKRKSNKFETSEKSREITDNDVQDLTTSGIVVTADKSSQETSNQIRSNKLETSENDKVGKEFQSLTTSGTVSEEKTPQDTSNTKATGLTASNVTNEVIEEVSQKDLTKPSTNMEESKGDLKEAAASISNKQESTIIVEDVSKKKLTKPASVVEESKEDMKRAQEVIGNKQQPIVAVSAPKESNKKLCSKKDVENVKQVESKKQQASESDADEELDEAERRWRKFISGTEEPHNDVQRTTKKIKLEEKLKQVSKDKVLSGNGGIKTIGSSLGKDNAMKMDERPKDANKSFARKANTDLKVEEKKTQKADTPPVRTTTNQQTFVPVEMDLRSLVDKLQFGEFFPNDNRSENQDYARRRSEGRLYDKKDARREEPRANKSGPFSTTNIRKLDEAKTISKGKSEETHSTRLQILVKQPKHIHELNTDKTQTVQSVKIPSKPITNESSIPRVRKEVPYKPFEEFMTEIPAAKKRYKIEESKKDDCEPKSKRLKTEVKDVKSDLLVPMNERDKMEHADSKKAIDKRIETQTQQVIKEQNIETVASEEVSKTVRRTSREGNLSPPQLTKNTTKQDSVIYEFPPILEPQVSSTQTQGNTSFTSDLDETLPTGTIITDNSPKQRSPNDKHHDYDVYAADVEHLDPSRPKRQRESPASSPSKPEEAAAPSPNNIAEHAYAESKTPPSNLPNVDALIVEPENEAVVLAVPSAGNGASTFRTSDAFMGPVYSEVRVPPDAHEDTGGAQEEPNFDEILGIDFLHPLIPVDAIVTTEQVTPMEVEVVVEGMGQVGEQTSFTALNELHAESEGEEMRQVQPTFTILDALHNVLDSHSTFPYITRMPEENEMFSPSVSTVIPEYSDTTHTYPTDPSDLTFAPDVDEKTTEQARRSGIDVEKVFTELETVLKTNREVSEEDSTSGEKKKVTVETIQQYDHIGNWGEGVPNIYCKPLEMLRAKTQPTDAPEELLNLTNSNSQDLFRPYIASTPKKTSEAGNSDSFNTTDFYDPIASCPNPQVPTTHETPSKEKLNKDLDFAVNNLLSVVQTQLSQTNAVETAPDVTPVESCSVVGEEVVEDLSNVGRDSKVEKKSTSYEVQTTQQKQTNDVDVTVGVVVEKKGVQDSVWKDSGGISTEKSQYKLKEVQSKSSQENRWPKRTYSKTNPAKYCEPKSGKKDGQQQETSRENISVPYKKSDEKPPKSEQPSASNNEQTSRTSPNLFRPYKYEVPNQHRPAPSYTYTCQCVRCPMSKKGQVRHHIGKCKCQYCTQKYEREREAKGRKSSAYTCECVRCPMSKKGQVKHHIDKCKCQYCMLKYEREREAKGRESSARSGR